MLQAACDGYRSSHFYYIKALIPLHLCLKMIRVQTFYLDIQSLSSHQIQEPYAGFNYLESVYKVIYAKKN